jgi:exodeoxyribonuclease V alpha subunit
VGKTRTLKKIAEVAASQGATIALAAPIGKAARRMTKSTGIKASTAHSLLGIKPGSSFKKVKPIVAELVIIDEYSLADMELTAGLIRALVPGQHLVLLGDVDQLRSIGAGNILGDIIDSGTVPTTRLFQNYRQDEQSTIVSVAKEINSGVMPTTWDKDCWFVQCTDDQIAPKIANVIARCVEQGYAAEDIMVLTGLRQGDDLNIASTEALNPYLQNILNPPSREKGEVRSWKAGRERTFRLGDRVIYGLNDEARDLVNGDIGTIRHVERQSQALTVEFNGSPVRLEKGSLKDLELAYANTVQRFQGDQAKVVIEAISMRHRRVLIRNLVYTGLTRAEKKCVFVGDKAALDYAVKRTEGLKRMTGLSVLLAEKKSQLGIEPTLQLDVLEPTLKPVYAG